MLAATAVALSIAPLAACGAGNEAQTLNMAPDNASAAQGDISILNANVVTAAEGGDHAGISARLYNKGDKDQTLHSITLPGTGAKVTLRPAKGDGPVVVPAGGTVALGGRGNASAEITDASRIRLGDAQTVVFTLSRTGDISLRALVVPAKHEYGHVGPSTTPAPEPTTSAPSGAPDGSPSATDGPDDEKADEKADEKGAPEGDRQSADASPNGQRTEEAHADH